MATLDIQKVRFGILSHEEILAYAPIAIDAVKVTKERPDAITLADARLGVYENGKICPRCNERNKSCPGHFARIDLAVPVINPLCDAHVLMFLRCFCPHCSKCVLSDDDLELHRVHQLTGEVRVRTILEMSLKRTICMNCNEQLFLYRQDTKDRKFYRLLKTTSKKISNPKIEITVSEIEDFFTSLTVEAVTTLGLDPKRIHPKNLIMRCLPVLPGCDRPNSIMDGNVCEDDLTVLYNEVFKWNELLKANLDNPEALRELNKNISAIMDNTDAAVKRPNGAPRKGIKERLSGKQGLIRGKMMGARVDFAARTVIGPEVNSACDELGVPRIIAEQLSFPERVTAFNRSRLQSLINAGKANFVEPATGGITSLAVKMKGRQTAFLPGDLVIRKREVVKETAEGEKLYETLEDVYPPYDSFILRPGDQILRKGKGEAPPTVISEIKIAEQRPFYCNIGDVVHRQLQDGDYGILNRQPTLHRGSMMGVRIKIHKDRTFRLPLPVTGSYNADYDGKRCRQQ